MSIQLNIPSLSFADFVNFIRNDEAIEKIKKDASLSTSKSDEEKDSLSPRLNKEVNIAIKTNEQFNILIPAKNEASQAALGVFSRTKFSMRSIIDPKIRESSSFAEEIDHEIDLENPVGVCVGMTDLFINRLLRTKGSYTKEGNEVAHLIRVAKDFSKGAPPESLLLQSFQGLKIIDYICSSSYCLSTSSSDCLTAYDNTGNEAEIKELIKNLSPGTYRVHKGYNEKNKPSAHAFALIKTKEENYYVFDANAGLLHFTKAEEVYKYFKGSSLSCVYHFILCDNALLNIKEPSFFCSTVALSKNIFATTKIKGPDSYYKSFKILLLKTYFYAVKILLFLPYILMVKYYSKGENTPKSLAARIYRPFNENLFCHITLREREKNLFGDSVKWP